MAATAFAAAVVLSTPRGPRFSPGTFTGELVAAQGPASPGQGQAQAQSPAAPGQASAPAKRFSISGSVVDLFPGARKTLTLRFENPMAQDIRVVTASVTVQSTNRVACPNTAVVATNYQAPADGGVVVPKRGSATLQVPIAMGADADAACSGATFSLAYSGTAVQA